MCRCVGFFICIHVCMGGVGKMAASLSFYFFPSFPVFYCHSWQTCWTVSVSSIHNSICFLLPHECTNAVVCLREELKKCRAHMHHLESERDSMFRQIQQQESDGNQLVTVSWRLHCMQCSIAIFLSLLKPPGLPLVSIWGFLLQLLEDPWPVL